MAHEQRLVERRVAAAPEAEQESVRRNAYRELKALRDHQRLAPDTLLQFAHEDAAVTVRDVLARLAEYEGKYLLDPEEPEYNGNRAVAWLSRDEKSGEVKVFSHAHGGEWRYVLVGDRQWEQQCQVEDGHAVLVDNANPMKPTLLQPSEGARRLLPVLHEMGVGYDAIQMEWMRYDATLGIWCVDPAVTQWNRVEDAIYTHAAGIGYTSHYVQELLTFLKGKMIAQVNQEETTRGLLPMRNGVLRLEDRVLLPHSPDYGFTWCLPYDYDPAATCEPVKQWLKEASGDDSVVAVLQAFLNAIVTGRADLQRYLELIGPGGSGKGTYLRLSGDLVGERNHYATTFKALEGNRFETAAIYNKRLVTIGDAEKWNGGVDTLKAMTGEDVLRYEAKHKQQNSDRKYTYRGMVLVAANTEIKSSDYTSGLQRRRIAVRFDKVISAGNRRNLDKEFAPLLPGVLNWVLELDTAEVTKRLRLTDAYSSAIAESNLDYLVATNPVFAWADECLVADVDAKSSINQAERKDISLYPSYLRFCDSTNKGSALSLQNFSSVLLDVLVAQLRMGWVKKGRTKHGHTIEGVRLRRLPDDFYTNTLATNRSKEAEAVDATILEMTKPEVMKQRILEGAQELVIRVNGSKGADRDGQVLEWWVSTTREENRLRAKAGIDEEGLSAVDAITHEALKSVGLPIPRLN
jgi:putative DNA primase/helicase